MYQVRLQVPNKADRVLLPGAYTLVRGIGCSRKQQRAGVSYALLNALFLVPRPDHITLHLQPRSLSDTIVSVWTSQALQTSHFQWALWFLVSPNMLLLPQQTGVCPDPPP